MRQGGLLRAYSVLLALTLGLAWSALAPQPAQAQASFDRPGSDYARVPILSGDPAVCALTCERDRRCRAWSFTYPSDPQDGAVCWLKNSVPQRTPSNCCVSGVRGAGVLEPRNSDIEASIDRYGGDYRSLDIKGDEGDDACKAACADDAKCRAWTYARPGYVGKEARCFLKKDIKPPRRKPGFISGVVR
jgi:hypothetical protein